MIDDQQGLALDGEPQSDLTKDPFHELELLRYAEVKNKHDMHVFVFVYHAYMNHVVHGNEHVVGCSTYRTTLQ